MANPGAPTCSPEAWRCRSATAGRLAAAAEGVLPRLIFELFALFSFSFGRSHLRAPQWSVANSVIPRRR